MQPDAVPTPVDDTVVQAYKVELFLSSPVYYANWLYFGVLYVFDLFQVDLDSFTGHFNTILRSFEYWLMLLSKDQVKIRSGKVIAHSSFIQSTIYKECFHI